MRKEEMMNEKNNFENGVEDIGCYKYIRSSKEPENMMTETAEFNIECQRWLESFGEGFTCLQDAKSGQEEYEIELETFRDDCLLFANYRESFIEIIYKEDRYDVHAYLYESDSLEIRDFSINEHDITEERLKEIEKHIMWWHLANWNKR